MKQLFKQAELRHVGVNVLLQMSDGGRVWTSIQANKQQAVTDFINEQQKLNVWILAVEFGPAASCHWKLKKVEL